MASGERAQAKQLGLAHYWTGKSCKNGHIAKRNTKTGKCLECRFPSSAKHREYNARWKAKYPGRDQEVKYRHRYGVELSLLRSKPSVCEICERPYKKIVFDHCHQSGAFRGWICDPCNVVLGNIEDNPEILKKMIDYLGKSEINQEIQNKSWHTAVSA